MSLSKISSNNLNKDSDSALTNANNSQVSNATSTVQQVDYLSKLPDELIKKIYEYLDPITLVQASRTCKRLNQGMYGKLDSVTKEELEKKSLHEWWILTRSWKGLWR